MASTLVKNYVHIVFSTKYRQHLLFESLQSPLYEYFRAICLGMECYPIAIGGVTDHVHILCNLSKKVALCKLLQEIKANSSRWIKMQDSSLQNFSWQDGYGAFSVNPHEAEIVIRYIENQKEHHAKKTFQQEFMQFLVKYKVEFDERYLWD